MPRSKIIFESGSPEVTFSSLCVFLLFLLSPFSQNVSFVFSVSHTMAVQLWRCFALLPFFVSIFYKVAQRAACGWSACGGNLLLIMYPSKSVKASVMLNYMATTRCTYEGVSRHTLSRSGHITISALKRRDTIPKIISFFLLYVYGLVYSEGLRNKTKC